MRSTRQMESGINTNGKVVEAIYEEIVQGRRNDRSYRKHLRELTNSAQERLERGLIDKEPGEGTAHFQVIDLFSGCGGMSLGFKALSDPFPFFRLIGGCDIDEDASKSYEANLGAPGVVADMGELAKSRSKLNGFLQKLSLYDERMPLVLIGCPPCQGFTSHRKKHWSDAPDDPRNPLLSVLASVAVELDPDCLIVENVPEMLAERYWPHFEESKAILTRAGYIVHQGIYNSASFGVPQERFRAIVMAMKREFLLPTPLVAPADFATVRDAIGSLPEVEPGVAHPTDRLHRSANHRRSTLETIRAVPKDGGNRPRGVGPECLDRVKGFYDVYGRLAWDKPAITITHYARNPASGRYVHPDQDRGLTMREAALLQSFPAWYEFYGSFDSIFGQIGEAVPPRLAAAIAAHTLVELLSPPPTNREREGQVDDIEVPVSSSYGSVIAGIKRARGTR